MRIRAVTRGGIAALITLMVLSFGTVSVVKAEGSGAGVGPVEWVLGLDGGMGVAGGTVGVTLTLEGPPELPVSVGSTLLYPPDDLEFIGPPSENCVLAGRLEDSHQVAGRVVTPGEVEIEVFVLGQDVLPLGEGDVVTCFFAIPLGVPNGTVAVMIDDPFLGDMDGQELPVTTRDGEVVIGDPTLTPTPTPTEVPPTSTPTVEPTDTPGDTPTEAPATNTPGAGTPTEVPATNTPDVGTPTEVPATSTVAPATRTSAPATATVRPQGDADDSCAIVPAEQSNPLSSLVLLLVPGVLLWARRRSL